MPYPQPQPEMLGTGYARGAANKALSRNQMLNTMLLEQGQMQPDSMQNMPGPQQPNGIPNMQMPNVFQMLMQYLYQQAPSVNHFMSMMNSYPYNIYHSLFGDKQTPPNKQIGGQQ